MTVQSKSTPTNFELVLPRLPHIDTVSGSQELTLNLHEVIIPSMTFDAVEVRFAGIFVRSDPSHNITYEDWNISYVVDAQFTNWRLLHDWMKFISSTNVYSTDNINPKDHTINTALLISDNFKNTILTIEFYDVWISSMGDTRLTYREGDMLIESTAVLKYSYYKIKD
jgi:hypothetical protein